MNRRLNAYLDKKGAKPLDDKVLKDYRSSMKDVTIPEAKKQVRKNEERAAELRFSPGPATRRQRAISRKKGK